MAEETQMHHCDACQIRSLPGPYLRAQDPDESLWTRRPNGLMSATLERVHLCLPSYLA
jgi:hypothetical protein